MIDNIEARKNALLKADGPPKKPRGKGWHGDCQRHSDARKYGSADTPAKRKNRIPLQTALRNEINGILKKNFGTVKHAIRRVIEKFRLTKNSDRYMKRLAARHVVKLLITGGVPIPTVPIVEDITEDIIFESIERVL